jgi:hypothetical protein
MMESCSGVQCWCLLELAMKEEALRSLQNMLVVKADLQSDVCGVLGVQCLSRRVDDAVKISRGK